MPNLDRTFYFFVVATSILVIVFAVFLLFPRYKLSDGTRIHRPVWSPPAARQIDPSILKHLHAGTVQQIEQMVKPTTLSPEWFTFSRRYSYGRRGYPTNPLFWVVVVTAAIWFGLMKWRGVF